jgi:isoleucyl-tRNA synthetase
VQLSSIYLDLSKDTMYCDAPASRSRRSGQTAMYEVLRGLVSVLAPILSYTADEIYEAMPGEKEASVHLTQIPKLEPLLSADDVSRWTRVLRLRDAVLAVLEQARASKQIGQSLEADVVLYGDIEAFDVDLAKLFIVSHVDLKPADAAGAETQSIDVEGIGRIGIAWTPARGQKCGRCWNYREEVAADGELCARCQKVVDELAPVETPTT